MNRPETAASTPGDQRDVSAGDAPSEVPLNAVILDPSPDQVVPPGNLRARGWAMGTGGRALTAIELSPNGGCHTRVARATDCTGAAQPAT